MYWGQKILNGDAKMNDINIDDEEEKQRNIQKVEYDNNLKELLSLCIDASGFAKDEMFFCCSARLNKAVEICKRLQ